MGKNKHYIAVTLLVVVVSVLLYFVLEAIYQLPVAASAEAVPIDQMFTGHFMLIAFLFALIMVFVVYAAVVFRRRPDDDEDGPHVHGHTGLEIMWTVLPTILVIGFTIWAAVVLNEITRAKPNEMVIRVHAQQWAWSFEYPEYENIASAELVLPVDRPIYLEMQSRDVIHSFWVPEFRVKEDVVPGRITNLRLTPTRLGDYTLLCAEICGAQHAAMRAPVRVLDTNAFASWVDERLDQPAFAELTPEERGAFWYGLEGFACSACHSTDGTQIVGPTWLGLYGHEVQLADGRTVIADDEYIHRSIVDPNTDIVAGFSPNIMPQDYEVRFAEREADILASEGLEIDIIEDLIAFIRTLQE